MTAADLQALHVQAQEDTALVQGVTDQATLRGLVAAADDAYTEAVQVACQTGNWGPTSVAAAAVHQARAALRNTP